MKPTGLVYALAIAASGLSALPALAQLTAIDALETTCIETQLDVCEVVASGYISAKDVPRIAFQMQSGSSNDFGVGAGAVLYTETDGAWTLLANDFNGVLYDMPRLSVGEMVLLHVAGVTAGTGAFNADLLFALDTDTGDWKAVDLVSWYETVDTLLPEGMQIWKGVDFNFDDWFYEDYYARTSLWLDSDANCCPSGGWATIHFDITDYALVARSVSYVPPEDDQ